MLRISLVALYLALPGAVCAAPVNLISLGKPDIQVTPVSVSYDATSNLFSVGMSLLGPVTGESLIIASDGTELAAEDLSILIEVFIDQIGGSVIVLPSGTGLTIAGNIFDDNVVGGSTVASGTLLTGQIIAAGFDQTTIELAWSLTGGEYLSAFGGPGAFALTLINGASFFDPVVGFGADFASGQFDFTVSTDTQAAVIPLPASLPILLTGLGALAIIRRRERDRERNT